MDLPPLTYQYTMHPNSESIRTSFPTGLHRYTSGKRSTYTSMTGAPQTHEIPVPASIGARPNIEL
jgi:hypothetical protein